MSLDDASVAALRAEVGEGALAAQAPVELDGRRIAWTLCTADAAALGRALRVLGERGLGAVVRGGGTRSGFGNPPRRADLVLSTRGFAELHEIDVDEGVAHLGAGVALAEVERALAGSGWELPLGAAGEDSTVGGGLAAAAVDPRRAAPRSAVLGLTVVLASGEVTHCGGRVVKNVTGYDLAKLHVGGHGSLGVIASAWLRLRPVAERVESWRVEEPSAPRALEAARRPSARAALFEGGTGSPPRLLVELAGDAAAVAVDAAWLRETCGARAAGPGELDDAFAAAARVDPVDALRVRIAHLPTRLAKLTGGIEAAGGRWAALPAHGLCWAHFPLPGGAGEARVDEILAATRAAAREGAGRWRLEAAPLRARRGRDVFGDPDAALPLMRALKARFDPAAVLNPGRFAGAL